MLKLSFFFFCFFERIFRLICRLQQHLSDEKESPNIVADDVSSCDEDESESEGQDEESLPMVIVRGMIIGIVIDEI